MIRDLLCLRGITEKYLNRLLLLLILKNSHKRCSVKKSVLENLANFIGKYLCWSLFLINLQACEPEAFLKRGSNTMYFSCEICQIFEST